MNIKVTSQDNLLKSEQEYRNNASRRVTFSNWFYQGRDLLTGKTIVQSPSGQKLLADKASNAGLAIGSLVSDYGTSYRQLAINARNVRTTKGGTEPVLLPVKRSDGDITVLFLVSAVVVFQRGNRVSMFHLLLVLGDNPDPDILEIKPTNTSEYNYEWYGARISCLEDQWVVSTATKYYSPTSVTTYPEPVTPITGNWAVTTTKSYLDGRLVSTTSGSRKIFVSPTQTADFFQFNPSSSVPIFAQSYPVIYGVTKDNKLIYKTRIASYFDATYVDYASTIAKLTFFPNIPIRIKELSLSVPDVPVISQSNQDGDGTFHVLWRKRFRIHRAWNTGDFIGSAVVYDMLLGRIDYRPEGVDISYEVENEYGRVLTYNLQEIPTTPYEMMIENGVLTVKYELFDDDPSDPKSRYKLLENYHVVDREVDIWRFVRILPSVDYGASPSIYFATPVGIANLQKPILTITIGMNVNPFLSIMTLNDSAQDDYLAFPYSMMEYHLNGVDLSSLPYSYTNWEEDYNRWRIIHPFDYPVPFEDLPIFNPPAGYEGFFLFGKCALSYNPRQDLYSFNNLEFESFDVSEWSGYVVSRFFLKQRREMYIPAPYIACDGDVSEYDGYNFNVPRRIKLDTDNKTSYWLSWSRIPAEYVYDYSSNTGTISSNWRFYRDNDEEIATISGVIQPLHTTRWYCRTSANDYIYDVLSPRDVSNDSEVPDLIPVANELANMVNSTYSVDFVADDFLPYGASTISQLELPPAVSGFDIDADHPPSQYFVSLSRQAPYPITTKTIWNDVPKSPIYQKFPYGPLIRHGTIFPNTNFHSGIGLSFSPNEMPEVQVVVYTCQYDKSGNYTYGFLLSQTLQGFDFGKWEIISALSAQYGTVTYLKFTVLDFDVMT